MKIIIYFLFFIPFFAVCQPNCNFFLFNKDTSQYEACKFIEENKNNYYQFDVRQMDVWETAVNICPYFAYPYRELSVPYVKSGDFIEWKKYMDKAVQYAPIDYLPVRASLKYKFFADYEGTIQDITQLEKLMDDIGYTSNGTYHLNTVKGLCLKELGRIDEAMEVMENQLKKDNHHVGLYDYLHLGVLYLEKQDYQKAIELFQLQESENDLAENCYYLAMAFKKLGEKEKAILHLQKSKEHFLKGRKMFDGYNELFDQIYLVEIDRALERI